MAENISQQLLQLPGAKSHETIPTVAKLIWTNNIPIKIKGWEGEEDRALVQSLVPDKESLKIPKIQNDASGLETLSLPSYGRGDVVEPEEPVEINGVKYPVATRKGIGSAQQPVVEKGEVYGTPSNLNPDKYSAGFTNEFTFQEDRKATEEWTSVGMRVRQPMRLFKLERVFMTSGSESVGDLANKFPHAAGAVESIWVTRNPITFEDAQQFFLLNSDPPDLDKLKLVANQLLQVQVEFLKQDEDVEARNIAELVKNGEGMGEKEWFSWLSSKYGEQMMRKTKNGLVQGEYHRQNSSLGVEGKDLGDVSGMDRELHQSKKNFGSWENAKKENPDMAREIIKENILQLVEIADLKVIFNVVNKRQWDDGVSELVEDFLQGMKKEDKGIFQDVVYRMYRMVKHNSSYFQADGRKSHDLYGTSELCFTDYMGQKMPILPNTPVTAEFLFSDIFEVLEKNIDPAVLEPKLREHFEIDHFTFQYKDMWSEEDILKFVELYNSITLDPEFTIKFNSILPTELDLNSKTNVQIFEQSLDKLLDLYREKIDSAINDYDRDSFVELFRGESGLVKFLANLIGRPEEQRRDYLKNNRPEIPKPIDTTAIKAYVKKYYEEDAPV